LLKPYGIGCCIAAIPAVVFHVIRSYGAKSAVPGIDAASLLLDVALLALWICRFTKPWVKLAADEYSSRLIAAAEVLGKEKATSG
jgi:hypothetical protein